MAHEYDMHRSLYVGEHLGVKYTLPDDKDPKNPRNDCDWLGTMACEHGRYNLGDEDGTSALTDAIRASKRYRDSWENEGTQYARFYLGDANTSEGISKMLPKCDDIIALPLYFYDHSGITMSTSAFSCRWDSGQVGFIFITMSAARASFPNLKGQKLRDKIIDVLKIEVEVYDKYLTNDVYGCSITGDDNGSLWGFYGDQEAAEAAEEYINGLTDEERASIIAAQAKTSAEGDQEACPC